MAEPIRPTAAKTFGRTNWIYVPTIANTAAPTAAEVNSASGLDITNMLYADQFDGVTAEPSRVAAPRRIGDTESYEGFGTTTYGIGDLVYSFDPQAAGGSNGKKAYEKFPAGTSGYLVRRSNVAKATTPAAGQFVSIYPVTFGAQLEVD